MKKHSTALRWAAPFLLLAAPSFLRYEGSDAATFVCTRDGETGGLCFAAPTLYQRVAAHFGVSTEWGVPAANGEPVVLAPLDDLGDAFPDTDSDREDGALHIYSNNDCWSRPPAPHVFCHGRSFAIWRLPVVHPSVTSSAAVAQIQSATAHRWNRFVRDERQRTFVLPRPRAFAPWHLLFYVAATLLTAFNLRRALTARTATWLRAVEAIPPTPMTPYRG